MQFPGINVIVISDIYYLLSKSDKEVIIHSEKMAMEESFNLIGSLKLDDLDSKKMQCKS